MKRTFLFLLAIAFLSVNSFAQSVIYEDDFEVYNVGEYLAVQAPEWTTWSNAPGTDEDAFISDDYALSPTKSVKIEGAVTDLVLPFGDKQNGVFEVAFSLYIETGFGGYYNLQHYEAVGTEWAIEVFFGSAGAGELKTDNITTPFSFSNGAWIDIIHEIDLDSDEAKIYFDGTLVHTWVWSTQSGGGAGANQLGALNIYASALSGDDPTFYLDDISYTQIFAPIYEDDFEDYTVGDYIAVVEPEFYTTWSNAPGSAEDALIVDEQAYSGDNSVEVEGGTDLIFKLGDKSAGVFDVNWMMYVPTGFAGYYNFQHMEAPGNEWAVEVYFNTDGSGECIADGITIPFAFTHDTWMSVEHMINLDDDLAEMYVDGSLIHAWVWSTQASGGAGTNQLGGVDFFAGAHTGETPAYYFDDVFFLQTGGATDPAIELVPMMFDDTIAQGTTADKDLMVSNIGGADLEYEISVVYEVSGKKSEVVVPMTNSMIFAHTNAEFEVVSLPNPGR
ncbi:MAG: hypothetical protein DRI83_06590 [Bacteroidetes bacterium]|nr:MAG: hypothetical protein DRI83_06590 [Bacteroidota bacterium]